MAIFVEFCGGIASTTSPILCSYHPAAYSQVWRDRADTVSEFRRQKDLDNNRPPSTLWLLLSRLAFCKMSNHLWKGTASLVSFSHPDSYNELLFVIWVRKIEPWFLFYEWHLSFLQNNLHVLLNPKGKLVELGLRIRKTQTQHPPTRIPDRQTTVLSHQLGPMSQLSRTQEKMPSVRELTGTTKNTTKWNEVYDKYDKTGWSWRKLPQIVTNMA